MSRGKAFPLPRPGDPLPDREGSACEAERPGCPRVAAFLGRYLGSHHVEDGLGDRDLRNRRLGSIPPGRPRIRRDTALRNRRHGSISRWRSPVGFVRHGFNNPRPSAAEAKSIRGTSLPARGFVRWSPSRLRERVRSGRAVTLYLRGRRPTSRPTPRGRRPCPRVWKAARPPTWKDTSHSRTSEPRSWTSSGRATGSSPTSE